MLGVPAADRHRFHRWSQAIVSANPSGWRMLLVIPHVWAFLRYIRRLIRREAGRPGGRPADRAGAGRGGRATRLSEDELVAMVFLLLVAGHETTVNLIGNGVLALLEHPDQMDRLRADPALIKPAVEELLRYASPLETATERYAREDVTVAGVTIPRGALVFAALASANRDERQFPDPDRLDIAREPNRHLSFGLGPTSASGRRSPGWRARWPSPPCSAAPPACGWPSRRVPSAGDADWCSGARRRCRWPCPRAVKGLRSSFPRLGWSRLTVALPHARLLGRFPMSPRVPVRRETPGHAPATVTAEPRTRAGRSDRACSTQYRVSAARTRSPLFVK